MWLFRVSAEEYFKGLDGAVSRFFPHRRRNKGLKENLLFNGFYPEQVTRRNLINDLHDLAQRSDWQGFRIMKFGINFFSLVLYERGNGLQHLFERAIIYQDSSARLLG